MPVVDNFLSSLDFAVTLWTVLYEMPTDGSILVFGTMGMSLESKFSKYNFEECNTIKFGKLSRWLSIM